ncbi:hypothetical protein FB561_6778 [Kribbella amoyensis]|uniref:Transcriptional regulator n=1 Tax=Kribbella amoyensis TaxID=996641 RepID=A0A561B904_9ACTN|nr:transcriptional regulator [Kribbella amoyensis]TWD75340.1 hypothetical protein FB561_6778 [Kribbella amoyensis]
MQWHRGTEDEPVSIGVVGPRDMVQQILLMEEAAGARNWRLVGAAHDRERQAYDQVQKVAGSVDVILFTGPLQYDLAREAGELTVPSTFVPVSGASLYSSIIRGLMAGTLDPSRVSIDSISAAEVEVAYADIGVSTERVHTLEYRDTGSVDEFVEFHRKLSEEGLTSTALTTVKSVAQRLSEVDVPALRLIPPANTIRIALNTAALLGAGSIRGDSQIVMVVVQVAPSSRPVSSGPQGYRYLELILGLHQLLLAELGELGVAIAQRDADTFVITATRGSLAQLTDRLQSPRFVDRVRAETGIITDLGVGVGETPRAAEEHAYAALARSRASTDAPAYLVRPDGSATALSGPPDQPASSEPPTSWSKAAETLARIVEVLSLKPGEPVVVDAEAVADGLGVTPRSARRMLVTLVDAGLAWPMPSVQSSRGGRPRQQFRLVLE